MSSPVLAGADLRVGRIPYLNALPFRDGFRGPEPAWTTATPRRLGELAAAGHLDAALLASRDALALAPGFRPLGDLGIASLGPVTSVLLLSRRPPMALSRARIALTGESRTSRGLLRILLRGPLAAEGVRFVGEGEPADAALWIGDRALVAHRRDPAPYVLDLGEAWRRFTGRPFVWARWVVRRDVPERQALALERALCAALERPTRLAGLPDGVSPLAARRYLSRFVYRLGPAEEAGLERFAKELADHDLLDPPLRGR